MTRSPSIRRQLAALCALSTLLCASLHADEESAATKETPKDLPWNVDAPPGDAVRVPIDVDEGTWMSLDVSPDGGEIVFDLLGDLYLLGVTGDARPLTSGVAWDMQPRFSPDGERIAFTSDRAGGDNIWIVDRSGENPRQVTKESFRLLNSPVWTPDGESIAARKHFSSRRSLGAGEIWLFHHTGGGGVQMVEKLNEQKDLGEPAFSPDGRYLYYSLDSTPGSTFEYNKDSNTGIYDIRRLDRETGETVTVTGGAGGAIRPTPSPDGKSLAFVRRIRAQSVLCLRDLASGEERELYRGLDRDLQEAWAIHGVSPAMAWMPRSDAIVFSARGKIRKIDVATGEVRTIPFRVRDEREIREAVRVPIEVAPAEFDVRMLRWVCVSPKGDRVAYQALGKIWIRDLPEGAPRRLTDAGEHFENYPSWSRDGQSIVYTTWSDESLASVRVRQVDSGEEKILETGRGHFIEPAISPDGETVVHVKTSGGYLTSPLWSSETGLWAISTGGGAPRRIASSGRMPHFGASSDRVFVAGSSGGKRTLESLLLRPTNARDAEPRVHLRSENATEFRVSPDGRWFAFRERFHVFVMPRTDTGGPIDVGPGTSSLPVKRVSKESGEYLDFSGDSRRLHWALGPDLFTCELKNAFAWLEGAPETLPDAPASAQPIGFRQAADRPEGLVALVGGRVVTMRERDGRPEILEEGTVLVRGDRIESVGATSAIEVPADARVIDTRGHTVLPGLIDVHAHGAQGAGEVIPQQNWISHSQLSFGVTTIHDPSADTSTIFAASEMQRAGLTTAPRIFSTGTILYGAAGDFKAEIDSLEDARFHLARMKAVGAFSVKSYNQPRREQRQQVIAAARELGMMVVPEGGSLLQHNLTMVVDGHTGVEHCVPVAPVYEDVLQLWSASKTGYTPTLGVAYGGISGEYYWYHHTDVWANERLSSFVPRTLLDARSRRPQKAPLEEYNHIAAARVAKSFVDRGITVQLGAHGQREGLAAHWELWMFEQGGMTPFEALRSGTLHGARYLGLDGDLGTLEAGKLADIIVIAGNPLANLRESERVALTMRGGRLHDAKTLAEIAPRARERAPFWFEREGTARPVAPTGETCGCGYTSHRH